MDFGQPFKLSVFGFWSTVKGFELTVYIFGQPFNTASYPFLDFGQPFKFFAIRLKSYGNRLNA